LPLTTSGHETDLAYSFNLGACMGHNNITTPLLNSMKKLLTHWHHLQSCYIYYTSPPMQTVLIKNNLFCLQPVSRFNILPFISTQLFTKLLSSLKHHLTASTYFSTNNYATNYQAC